jgi:hypothetical protein
MGYAEPLRLLGIAEWLQGALGVSPSIAEFLSVFIILFIFILPLIFLKVGNYPLVMIGVMLMSVFTAIGWLPFYTWIMLAVYCAIVVSEKWKGGI